MPRRQKISKRVSCYPYWAMPNWVNAEEICTAPCLPHKDVIDAAPVSVCSKCFWFSCESSWEKWKAEWEDNQIKITCDGILSPVLPSPSIDTMETLHHLEPVGLHFSKCSTLTIGVWTLSLVLLHRKHTWHILGPCCPMTVSKLISLLKFLENVPPNLHKSYFVFLLSFPLLLMVLS